MSAINVFKNRNTKNKVEVSLMFGSTPNISSSFNGKEKIVLYHGNCLNLLDQIPNKSIQLIVTSPPYNIGKMCSA